MDDARSRFDAWARQRHRELVSCERFSASAVKSVTVLAYAFGTETYLTDEFWRVELAYLQTFATNGRMPGILVCNRATARMRAFCARQGIDLHVEPSLVPGDIGSMSRDCLARLGERFTTDYVLIVQNDGFPMRGGLAEFVAQGYDYIGAPFVRWISCLDWYPYRYNVGNGGFSLRSRRLCQDVGRIYRRWFRRWPFWPRIFGDDNFYCRFLRCFWPGFNRRFCFAPPDVAGRFSIECNAAFWPTVGKPLGFHSMAGWERWWAHG